MADDVETELTGTLAAVSADLDAQRRRMDELAGELCQSLEAVATAAYDELRALAERVDQHVDRLGQTLAELRGVTRGMTRMPAEAFDALAASLDKPDDAPGLATAARRAQRNAHIAPASDTPEDAALTEVQAPMSPAVAAKATGSAEGERQLKRDTALLAGIEHSRQHPEELRCRDRSGAPRAE